MFSRSHFHIRKPSLLLLLPLFYLFSVLNAQAVDAPYEIYTLSVFTAQPSCLQQCFLNTISPVIANDLPDYLSCSMSNNQYQSACICADANFLSASAFLDICVYEGCQSQLEVSSAISLFNGYCTRGGVVLNTEPAAVDATTTTGNTSPATATANSPTSSSSDSSNSSSSSNSNSNSDTTSNTQSNSSSVLSTSDKIGIGIGVVGAVAGIAGAYFAYKQLQILIHGHK
jgi:hypothetical protein